jgi:phosphotransferase system HPr (HPr) family protein
MIGGPVMSAKRIESSNALKLFSRLQGYKEAKQPGKLSAAVKTASFLVPIEKEAAIKLSELLDLKPFVTNIGKKAATLKLTAENIPTVEQINTLISSPEAKANGLFGAVEALSFNAKTQDGSKEVAIPTIFKKGSTFTAGNKVTALVAGRFYEVDSFAAMLKYAEEIEVLFQLGLHLRSVAIIVPFTSRSEFKATKITFSNNKGRSASGKDIMNLPGLAKRGEKVLIEAEGPDAERLVKEVIKLMNDPENIKKA